MSPLSAYLLCSRVFLGFPAQHPHPSLLPQLRAQYPLPVLRRRQVRLVFDSYCFSTEMAIISVT
jgi:hypothetical protein